MYTSSTFVCKFIVVAIPHAPCMSYVELFFVSFHSTLWKSTFSVFVSFGQPKRIIFFSGKSIWSCSVRQTAGFFWYELQNNMFEGERTCVGCAQLCLEIILLFHSFLGAFLFFFPSFCFWIRCMMFGGEEGSGFLRKWTVKQRV